MNYKASNMRIDWTGHVKWRAVHVPLPPPFLPPHYFFFSISNYFQIQVWEKKRNAKIRLVFREPPFAAIRFISS